ncbi:cathepsin L-like [Dermatophagoides pteronyssinus]
MLKTQLLIGFVMIVMAQAIDPIRLEHEWASFKKNYNRTYRSSEEEQFRKQIFADKLDFIEQHNQLYYQKKSSFLLGVNQFADKSVSEFRRMNGLIASKGMQNAPKIYTDNDVESLPAEVDWTKKGVVAPIKNQGNCGSCWAFSAVGSMESAHALATGHLVELSEQELVDCSGSQGDNGCEGGWMDNGFKFVIQNHGIDTEKSYPYAGIDELCESKDKGKVVGATIRSYVDVKKYDEHALQSACAKVGPISVGIDASSNYFMMYKSGVYDHDDCSQDWLDHGVVVVGYGTSSDGKEYWKVRNSWGTTWGMDGYILMSRNKNNQCGIASQASYPIV